MKFHQVGQRIPRTDAAAKVTGAARFLDDLSFPGMLHGAVCRSPHPHARIRGIDTAPASAIPGVAAVATHRDVPGRNVVHVVADDQPALADGVVRYAAEPVALVAAETRGAARAAAAAIRVDYEPLPPLLDLRASRTSPIRIFGDQNVFSHGRIRRGDAPAALDAGDLVVLEGEYTTGYQEHAYLETQGMIAVPEGDGGITVYGSMQAPFYVQGAVCDVLGMPLARVRVVQTVTGGAFGGKEDFPSVIAAQAAILARKTGRPVKLVYAREEDVACSSKRHPSFSRIRVGARKDGTLVAGVFDFLLDGGAYCTLSPVVLDRAVIHAPGPYRWEHVHVDGRAVATHRVPTGAYRGFGSPQVIFALECHLDKLAAKLGIDPAELRRKNLLRPGDETACGQRLERSVGAIPALDGVLAKADWATPPAKPEGTRRRGRGLATLFYGSGLHIGGRRIDRSDAFVQLHADGSITVAVGTTEMGQGMNTVLSQIAAEALGARAADVRMMPPDTSRVPDSGPTVASRATTCSGNAIRDACRPIRASVVAAAARMLGVAEADVAIADAVVAGGGRTIPLADVAAECSGVGLPLGAVGHYVSPHQTWDRETGIGDPYVVYAYAAVVADVEVDTETGQVAVERIVAAHDVGKAINPSGVETQIEGGSVQGAGYAVWEELLAPEGVILNPSFTTYILPTALDAPRVDPVVVEETYPGGPFGAKGFAEQPLMGIAPAIANAVFDAIGVRIDDLPVSPERIRAALRGEPGRYRRSVGAAPKTAHFPAPLPAEGEPIAIAITVNGVARSTSVRPDETLAETLRERFRLTGTKVGCGKGECGACTVLLDGKPVNACLVLAFEADGRAVTTIEGLAAPDGTLDPVQQAFVDHFAVQCGFCTPGLVLATKALLAEDPHPDEATARRALAGNICRCTGYGAVLRAVRAAAERKE